MGEKPLKEIIRLLQRGVPFSSLTTIPQTAYLADLESIKPHKKWEDLILLSHEQCASSKQKQLQNFKKIERETNKMFHMRLIQGVQDKAVVVNPPYPPLSSEELDETYEYPYMRTP